jgi:hypothetical protein
MASATCALVYTELEDNTRPWERHPQAVRVALARHDDLLAHAICQAVAAAVALEGPSHPFRRGRRRRQQPRRWSGVAPVPPVGFGLGGSST